MPERDIPAGVERSTRLPSDEADLLPSSQKVARTEAGSDAGGERLVLHVARRLQRAEAKLAESRDRAAADRASAQECLRRMQDMQAEIFRLNDQLGNARLDADEAYARTLDLESEVRHEQSRFLDLQARSHQVGEMLHKAVDAHAEANTIWQGEIARIRDLHDNEVAQLRELHQQEIVRNRDRHDNEVVQLRNLHQQERAHVRDSHEIEVARIREAHKYDVARLDAQARPRVALMVLWRALIGKPSPGRLAPPPSVDPGSVDAHRRRDPDSNGQ